KKIRKTSDALISSENEARELGQEGASNLSDAQNLESPSVAFRPAQVSLVVTDCDTPEVTQPVKGLSKVASRDVCYEQRANPRVFAAARLYAVTAAECGCEKARFLEKPHSERLEGIGAE
ncbi:hypothetical protein, partial [Bradyrhizobium sp. 33ap4]|uniref:hypothetical protein n=1 Tax=Bradyrhizobium sp. 33ap4 TaxID=3061630 RepID=UPI0029313B39